MDIGALACGLCLCCCKSSEWATTETVCLIYTSTEFEFANERRLRIDSLLVCWMQEYNLNNRLRFVASFRLGSTAIRCFHCCSHSIRQTNNYEYVRRTPFTVISCYHQQPHIHLFYIISIGIKDPFAILFFETPQSRSSCCTAS